MATYYAQRASAGLIITEATQVTPEGQGYINTPGIHSAEQVEGWKQITKAVHDKGGRIFLQLWHVGRISHSLYQPGKALPVSASAIAPEGQVHTPEGMKPFETPRPLETDEIAGVVEKYRQGAKNALDAGFDGVEIHAANGYLIDQFLQDGTNKRTDRYGGSVENRARFLLEVTNAVVSVWGADRVGIRLSPNGTFNSMSDTNPSATFTYALKELNKLNLVYVHLRRGTKADVRHGRPAVSMDTFRPLFSNAFMLNDQFDRVQADDAIEKGLADFVAFGAPFISNPDLPKRLETGASLAKPDSATFYGGAEKGYTDYPTLEEDPSKKVVAG
jgi:N-ethylmaleimide reductase